MRVRSIRRNTSGTNARLSCAAICARPGIHKIATLITCKATIARRRRPAGEIIPRSRRNASTSRFSGSRMAICIRDNLRGIRRQARHHPGKSALRQSQHQQCKEQPAAPEKCAYRQSRHRIPLRESNSTIGVCGSANTPTRISSAENTNRKLPGRKSRYKIVNIFRLTLITAPRSGFADLKECRLTLASTKPFITVAYASYPVRLMEKLYRDAPKPVTDANSAMAFFYSSLNSWVT